MSRLHMAFGSDTEVITVKVFFQMYAEIYLYYQMQMKLGSRDGFKVQVMSQI